MSVVTVLKFDGLSSPWQAAKLLNGQKMSGRFGPLPGRSPEPYYESCDEWLKNVP